MNATIVLNISKQDNQLSLMLTNENMMMINI